MNLIEKALIFATNAHSGQTRKKTSIPFILHCIEASNIAREMTEKNGSVNQNLIAAQLLHDTVEDTETSIDVIKEKFGEEVASIVEIQTEDKTKTWDERKQHTMEILDSNESIEVEMAYLSDKLSNMRSLSREYIEKGEELWGKFNAGKEKQKWYYSSIADKLKLVRETEQYKEYVELINILF